MRHLVSLLNRHPHLHKVDYKRLALRAGKDPATHWDELVEGATPLVYRMARRLAQGSSNVEMRACKAVAQTFAALREDDYRRLRGYIGQADFPSYVVRILMQSPALAEIRTHRTNRTLSAKGGIADPNGRIVALDPRVGKLLEEEGDRFQKALRQVIGVLHRRDRLILAMRYEQGLTLREMDELFRLGTPARVKSLIDRLVDRLQPLNAVSEAWSLDEGQKHAVLKFVLSELFAAHSFESNEDRPSAPALQGR